MAAAEQPSIWRRLRAPLWLAAIAAVLAYGGFAFWRSLPEEAAAPAPALPASSLAQLGTGADDVTLQDDSGAPIRWGDLKGRPRAVFFGFTHCPDVCPTTAADLSAAIDRLGPAGQGLTLQFVSVDPGRDDPAKLKAYFSAFEGRVRGYTGAAEEVDRLAKAFKAYYSRVPLQGEDYTIDHTTLTYLLDADGRVVDLVAYQAPPERTEAQLRRLLGL